MTGTVNTWPLHQDMTQPPAGLAPAPSERVTRDGATVTQSGWRLMEGIAVPDPTFAALTALWEGLLAAHNRRLALETRHTGDGISWRVGA